MTQDQIKQKNLTRIAILICALLYVIAVLVQRFAYEITGLYTSNSIVQNFVENLVGLAFVLLAAIRLNLWHKIHWFNREAISKWYLFLLPLAYVLLNMGDLYPHSERDLMIGLASNIFTGFLEEILCRGMVIVLLLDYLKAKGQGHLMFKAALLSSLMFGLVHFVNVFEKPETIGVIGGQVIYATFIGMGFAACYLRTLSLLPLIVIHVGINMVSFLTSAPDAPAATSFIHTIPAILICAPLMVYGTLLLIREPPNLMEPSKA